MARAFAQTCKGGGRELSINIADQTISDAVEIFGGKTPLPDCGVAIIVLDTTDDWGGDDSILVSFCSGAAMFNHKMLDAALRACRTLAQAPEQIRFCRESEAVAIRIHNKVVGVMGYDDPDVDKKLAVRVAIVKGYINSKNLAEYVKDPEEAELKPLLKQYENPADNG